MGDVKRWSVTYTKHIKQKRKVYQDGFLEVFDSSHKILLYDDCEKLLERRNLKKDDVVGSGETLAFDAYLVDIGDLDGDHKFIPHVNSQGSDKNSTEKSGLVYGKKFKHNSVPIEDRKPNSGKNKAPSSNLSPSHKIIREFKKNEMNKYGASRNCPDTTKTSYSEWHVLYSTQITQKAKKYHDGIIRVATSGLQGRQVTLYDVSRRLLDSRFLKKDEVIGSGESLAFDGHLVDIGEPEGYHEPLLDLKVQGRTCIEGGITRLSHGQQTPHSSSVGNVNSGSSNSMSPLNNLKAVKTSTRVCQATLLNEDGTILSRKFVKLSEDVRSGNTFELPHYLVEVGELQTNPEGEPRRSACSEKYVDSNFSNFHVRNFKMGRAFPIDKPSRDANEILSILRKPMTQEVRVPVKSASVEQPHASQSSECIQFDLQNQVERHLVQDSCERIKADNHDVETSKRQKPGAFHDDLTVETVKLADSESMGESQLKYFTPLSSFPRSEASDRSISEPVSFIEKPQFLDAIKLNCPDDSQQPTVMPHEGKLGNNRNMEGNSVELVSSKASSACHSEPFSEELKLRTSPQPDEESLGNPTKCHEGDFSRGITNSDGCISHDCSDTEKQSSKECKSTIKMDEIPSFDLGF